MYDGTENKKTDLDLLRRLPVPRGKIVIAVILVTTMVLMWGRLFFSGKDGNTAVVSAAVSNPAAASPRAHTSLIAVELPAVAGRHDRLARDFFTTANWKAFRSLGGPTSRMAPPDLGARQGLTEYDIAAIEQNVKLDGIIAEQSRQTCEAFVNGKLVTVGSRIPIDYKSRQYTLTVIAISKNKVILGLENFTLNVAMPQAESLNN